MKAGRIDRLTAFEEGSKGKKGADAADGGKYFSGQKTEKRKNEEKN